MMETHELALDLEKLAAGLKAQWLLHRIGLAGLRIIKSRTRHGRFLPGSTTTGYSPGHARRRQAKGLSTSRVNLEFTLFGGMLEKMDHVVTRDLAGVELLLNDPRAEQIAVYHNIEGAGKSRLRRIFFDLADPEIGRIEKLAVRHVDELLTLSKLQ